MLAKKQVKLDPKIKLFEPTQLARHKKVSSDDRYASSEDGSIFEDSDDQSESDQYKERTTQRIHRRSQNELNRRTIFVGNLPVNMTRKCLHKLFTAALKKDEQAVRNGCRIESVRIRGVVPASGSTGKLSRKRAVIQKETSAGLSQTLIAYVVLSSTAGISAAKSLNGHWLEVGKSISPDVPPKEDDDNNEMQLDVTSTGRHIRVDCVGHRYSMEYLKRSIFLGNLPFDVLEEEVRSAFSKFGEIFNVRLIRDKQTGAVKGFGFVQFLDPASTPLAIRASGTVFIRNRAIRVQEWKESTEQKKYPKWQSKVRSTAPKNRTENKVACTHQISGLRLRQRGQAKGITLPSNLRGLQRSHYLEKRLLKKRKRQLSRKKQNNQSVATDTKKTKRRKTT